MYKIRIILIEPDRRLQESIVEILHLSAYEVLAVADIAKAQSILLPNPAGIDSVLFNADLIICDIALPPPNGYLLLKSLQQHRAIGAIPFIFIGEFADKATIRKAMEAGADDCLAIPFEPIELLSAIEACLVKKKRQRQQSAKTISRGLSNETDSLLQMLNGIDPKLYKKKEPLYTEGQHATQLWYIVSGKIKTYRSHEDGKELITKIYGPGEMIGLITAIDGACYPDNARVIEESRLLPVSRQEFIQLLNGSQGVSGHLLRLLASHSTLNDEGLVNFAYSSLRKRVANGLLRLANIFPSNKDGLAFISLSRDNLAGIIGSAPESLTRTLSEFKKEKLIQMEDGGILLLDTDRLRKLIN